MFKRYIQIFTLVLISAAIATGVSEFLVRWMGLFGNERMIASQVNPDELLIRDGAASKAQLHPFFGWSMQPGTRGQQNATLLNRFFPEGVPQVRWWENYAVNTLGFTSKYLDYRDIHNGRFVIGIFGGSVADLFANMASETMLGRLSKILAMPEDKILILNFAAGGYKQPQQINALTYATLLGIHFDVIINIDGFNEMALGGSDCQQGYHPIYPSRFHLASATALSSGRMTTSSMKLAIEIAGEKKKARRMFAMLNNSAWLRESELVKVLIGAIIAKRSTRAAQLEHELQKQLASDTSESPIPALPDPGLSSSEGCWKLVSEIWAKGSVLMANMASRSGAKYIHILQPNQYIPESKPLSKAELDYAYSPDDEWSKNVVGAYPFLKAHSKNLRAQGIVFRDLTGIFKHHQETIYIDPCCHFNIRGNEILFNSLGAILSEVVRG